MGDSERSTELTPKQAAFIAALLSSPNITMAAAAAGVAESTARRWRHLPHFQEALKAAQDEVFSDALNSLKLLASDAVDALRSNLSGELVPAAVQVRAAQIILSLGIELHEVEELRQKVAELDMLLRQGGYH